ncbi:hypothetical protein CLU79DRAFT_836685 [Phycomyces nitens]|nr:hypothetical protein CLU79DRAFT_836685 [Phycomyces nitens]
MDKTSDLHTSAPAPPPPRYRPLSETSVSDPYSTPPPAYQPTLQYSSSLHVLPSQTRASQPRFPTGVYSYQPLPTPEVNIIHDKPTRSHDACCWGCLVAVLLCFGIKECC